MFLVKNVPILNVVNQIQRNYQNNKYSHQFNKKVRALKVSFSEVGIGVNTNEELEESQAFYKKIKTPKK